MAWWLVTELSALCTHPVQEAALVEAGSEREAATLGVEYLMDAMHERARDWHRATGQEFDWPDPIADVLVQAVTGARWRGIVGAERVPDALQCCGGMPNEHPFFGTYDQHTASCPVRPMEVLRWGPQTREESEAWDRHYGRGGGGE